MLQSIYIEKIINSSGKQCAATFFLTPKIFFPCIHPERCAEDKDIKMWNDSLDTKTEIVTALLEHLENVLM